MTRYYDPYEYSSQGFSTPIIMSTDLEYPVENFIKDKQVNIAKSESSVFEFKLLDTSAIALIDFSSEYTNYSVEKESSRFSPSYGY